jgi:non-heme chloroperoxidase
MKRICLFTLLFILLYMGDSSAQNPEFKIPNGCKEKYFQTSDSVRFRYLVAGSGEALIFIPGWTMTAEIWELQIEYFARTNMVIALDPRGQGKSDAVNEGLYFEREARDVKELTDHLKLPSFYLIGWSWAGPMLYYYGKLYNSPALKGIIEVDPPLRITDAYLQRLAKRMKGLLHDRDRTVAEFVKGLFKPPISETYLQKVKEGCLMTNTTSAVTMLAIFFSYNDAEWIQLLKEIDKPILFIGADGKQDAHEQLNKEVKINYLIVPGAGHAVFIDKPVEFNKAVKDFISKK